MHARKSSCQVAFDNHYKPIPLVDAIAAAEQSPNAECHRWPGHSLPARGPALYEDVLQRTVCVIMLRDPIDRAIAAYYEWHFQKTSPLTPMEYLDANGAQKYIALVNHTPGLFWEYTTPPVWEATLKSCLIGVTEKMDQFVQNLSRVLRIESPEHAVKQRSRPRTGMTQEDTERFYKELTPLMHDDINLWHLAGRVADAQHAVAQLFDPLMTESLVKPEDSCFYCETCFNEVDPWLGIHWKVFRTPDSQTIGYLFDENACCIECPVVEGFSDKNNKLSLR
jgi:hypothetical protein